MKIGINYVPLPLLFNVIYMPTGLSANYNHDILITLYHFNEFM